MTATSGLSSLAISNKTSNDVFAWQFQYNSYAAPVSGLPANVSIGTQLVALPTLIPAGQTVNLPLASQVRGSDGKQYNWQLGQRFYITPATEKRFYTQDLTISQVPADPFGVSTSLYSWNETPFTSFEYSVDASGNLTYDSSYIDDGSYPVTWLDSGSEFGFQSLDLAKAWLASVSFISPSLTQYNNPITNGDASDLILRSSLLSNGTLRSGSAYPSDGNRLIGPNKLWALTYGGSPLPSGNDPNGNSVIPAGALAKFNMFLSAVPATGSQLSVANKGGPDNYTIWQNGLPPGDSSSSPSLGYPASDRLSPSNGYTYALQRAADAVAGRGPQPGSTNGASVNLWQSFFTYPQENIYGQTTESAGSISVQQLNVYPLTSSTCLVGSGDNDVVTGTPVNETIVGGLGGDRLTGGGGVDTFLYLTMPSSATRQIGGNHTTIDSITDFNPANDFIDLRQLNKDLSGPSSPYPGFSIAFSSGDFTGQPGSLRFTKMASNGFLDLDANGDRIPDFSISLAGVSSLTQGSWLLI